MTTTSTGPGRALFFIIPGTLFWGLVIAGAVTANNTLIGAAVVLAVVTVIVNVTLKIRASAAAGAARADLWARGTPARARVVRLTATGARINHDPEVDLELDVTLPDQPPHRVTVRSFVSSLAVPRVQPDSTIDVRVDPADRTRVVIDPSLTQ